MSQLEPLQVTMAEAARLLSISRRTLDDWRRDGLIATRKIGRLRFVPMSELRRLTMAPVGNVERASAEPVAGDVSGQSDGPLRNIAENQRVIA